MVVVTKLTVVQEIGRFCDSVNRGGRIIVGACDEMVDVVIIFLDRTDCCIISPVEVTILIAVVILGAVG